MPDFDRLTIGTYMAHSWAEVRRQARQKMLPATAMIDPPTEDERAMMGLPVHAEWIDDDGDAQSALGVLVRIEPDTRARWAIFDDGFGFDTKAAGFAMRPATLPELKEMQGGY